MCKFYSVFALAVLSLAVLSCSSNKETLPDNVIDDSQGVTATLTWNRPSAEVDLDLFLLDGTNIIASSEGISNSEEVSLTSSAQDKTYTLRVDYFSGSGSVTYTVTVRGINSGARTRTVTGTLASTNADGIITIVKSGNRYTIQ